MKYKNTPHKRRKLYRKSEQNREDLESLENKEDRKKFSDNLINAIKTLYDSDYEQKAAVGITNMFDYSSAFDNADYDWKTFEEFWWESGKSSILYTLY